MTLEQVLAAADAALPPLVAGWCSKEKSSALIETIMSRKPELCIELGVFGGSSLIPQAMALKANGRGKIVGIDPWTTDAALEDMSQKENREWWGSQNLESVYQHCLGNVKKFGVEQQVEIIRDKAEAVADRFTAESVDLLHIDGNHAEDPAYRDATLYLPKVKPGGIIFFDDIYWTDGHEDATTRKAIVYLLQHCTKLRLVGDCMLLQKD